MNYINRLILILTLGNLYLGPLFAKEAPIRIGVTSGPHALILNAVKNSIKRNELEIEIIEYTDIDKLNADLALGKLDANSFQDTFFLQSEIKAKGYPLIDVAYTVTLPMAYYSARIKSLGELQNGDQVALPEDPINRSRALILLNNYGLIRITDGKEYPITLDDIIYNPKQLKFLQQRKLQLDSELKNNAAVALSYPLAESLGLYPARDSIAMEDGRSPFAHVLVTRRTDREKPWVNKLISAYRSNKIKQFILLTFQDSVRRPW
jgi:D-methionine transport system substrate-binding protein